MEKIDYLFETSWEICNKVGGIYTVISTKARTVTRIFEENYICIGPDLSKENNQDFIEDPVLYRTWRELALREGLRVRIGRWQIAGSPVVILVDFTTFFEKKNDIFTELWIQNKLDSIAGQWDYVEPALFGYAAGKVIESFYRYYCTASEKIIAHFHEWMTGTGVLYLKNNAPQIGTVFTTHATVLGRGIAGNGFPLYSRLNHYDPNEMAIRLGTQSKQSLEAVSAENADAFTTVSSITQKECIAFLKRDTDTLTINGFEPDFIPKKDLYPEKRKIARQKLLQVAKALLQQPIQDDALLVINSGRYEYRNKGIDLFTEGLSKLRSKQPDRDVVAFITVPAGTSGLREDLIRRMENPAIGEAITHEYLTHPLYDPQNDPVLNGFKKYNLNNTPDSKVKVIFVPVYLNGADGIFNLSYYDLLPGFDLSVFPSYYEPWGYTPLESAAFGIPTVTTSLAGFGKWVQGLFPEKKSVWVIERDDFNDQQVSDEIADAIAFYLHCNPTEKERFNEEASEIAMNALWEKLFDFYLQSYQIANGKSGQRYELYKNKTSSFGLLPVKKDDIEYKWTKLTVKSKLPEQLVRLVKLSENLWWSWNWEARELFEEIIGKEAWKTGGENPVLLLQMLPQERIALFENNQPFLDKLDRVYNAFTEYMNEPRTRPEKKVAYFSMEFGLSNELKIFSGGLGMLAGDYLKEASDANVNMIGVGLLYQYGYFTQQISHFGDQISLYNRQSFSKLPIHPVRNEQGEWQKICIAFPGRDFYARIWRVNVGRIPLYLLDTDVEENRDEDRGTTGTLYGGDHENRLKQEVLLGIGGVRMLNLLNEKPDIYHLNEGHAAFLSLERLRNIIQEQQLSLPIAIELVRASSLYTTHTPVPAGHDTFSEDLMRKYFSQYHARYNIKWDNFMALGRGPGNDPNEKFSMSILACTLSQEINGVSRIHGEVTRKMFTYLYPGHFKEELPIGYVTNGVHYPTWAHKEWQKYHHSIFGKDFEKERSNPEIWGKIEDKPDGDLWTIKENLRQEMFTEIKQMLEEQMKRRNESPAFIIDTLQALNPKSLTIGFARRFATYKRAYLLFTDEERLNAVINNPNRPITFIFAGKAHPNDKAGQDLINKIIHFSRKPAFIGKIIFLENYDMVLAKKLVSGCDVWLNTPTRPLEASGTSGEKAVMNGVLNFSVLDGWWAEGYKKGAGWAINEDVSYQDHQLQDELDASTIYHVLKDEIAPTFYERNEKNIPEKWVEMMKKNFMQIAPHFTMKRQLDDYYERFYHRLEERSKILLDNNLEAVTQLIKWKNKVIAAWDNIEIVHVVAPDITHSFLLGDKLPFEVSLMLGNLDPKDIKIELLLVDRNEEEDAVQLSVKIPFMFEKEKDGVANYRCEIKTDIVGTWCWAIRIIPQNPLLPDDTDLNLTKWP